MANKATENEAKREALKACRSHTQQKCTLFAVNEQVIFNDRHWYTLWAPFKTQQQVKALTNGVLVGQKFPDLVYIDPDGKKTSVHASKGKLRFVHFWGSWCPSCVKEFPAIIDLYRILNDVLPEQVEFVIVQVREKIETSKLWLSSNSLNLLPLSDSGIQDEAESQLYLSNGERINDRRIAKIFPTTYVLDKNGVVVFSNMGSVENWTEYVNFFKDAAEFSGK